jgi:hypothetical protein
MRGRIEWVAAVLPASLNLSLLAAIATLLLVNFTDSWLPRDFVGWLRHLNDATGTTEAAGAGAFCLFMLAAMFLYVLSLSVCGLMVAIALRLIAIKVWRLAGR